MRIRKSVTLGALMLLLGGSAKAVPTLVGAVTVVAQGVIHVKTNDGGVRELALDEKTEYVRWITHQPWQQSTVADRSFIKVGRCISVEPRADDDHVAKLIRVNTDEPGTIWCPCRTSH